MKAERWVSSPTATAPCATYDWCGHNGNDPDSDHHWGNAVRVLWARVEAHDERETVDVTVRHTPGDPDPVVNLGVGPTREGSALLTPLEALWLSTALLEAVAVLSGNDETTSEAATEIAQQHLGD